MAYCCSYQVAMQYADKSTGELLKKLACRGMCACVSVCPGTCICAFIAIGVVLKRFFIFLSYPSMDELCNYHTHIPSPPPTGERNCLLLTVLKQSCHSRVAALQGCTAPVCRFPGCHSLGKHLLFSVTVMQHGHAAEAHSTRSITLRCPSTVRGACRTETPIWQEGDCWEGTCGAPSSAPQPLLCCCVWGSPAALVKIQILGWGWRFCIFKKLPGDAEAPGPWTTF